ncbi:MAG: hypothetical protein FWG72_10905, partial [Oscillospiraceae bacterium]|nr:hypothetical protein [Oscillospiraceae bacterium]
SGIQAQADNLTKRLADAKMRVERTIDGLPSVQRRLMRGRYIEGKSWLVIVEEMGFSEIRLYELHKLALSNITKKQAKRRDNGVRPQKRSEYRAASE